MHENVEQGKRTTDATGAGLYPQLSEKDRREALANLRRYFEIVVAIADETAQARGLTHPASITTMKERSNVDLKN
jgi:hypothetical protein